MTIHRATTGVAMLDGQAALTINLGVAEAAPYYVTLLVVSCSMTLTLIDAYCLGSRIRGRGARTG